MFTKDAKRQNKAKRQRRRVRQKNKKPWSVGKKAAVTLISVVALVLVTVIGMIASKLGKLQIEQLNPDDIVINTELERDTGYLNVALFGVDSRENSLDSGDNRTDTIIVASLNQETGEVKLCSVYRDTLLEIDGEGSYSKANAAYAYGDAAGAISMLNRNLDLDIEKYITVDFNAMVDIIDAVGGVEIDVQEEEITYINGYATEIIKATGKDSVGVFQAGTQVLNGTQATAYARIRYTAGSDFRRTERQREVLSQLAGKLQECSLTQLLNIVDSVFPKVKTNFTLSELASYAKKASSYAMGETTGFPYTYTTGTLSGIGSVVIATDLEGDVSELHNFLYGTEGYQPTSVVEGIAAKIQAKAYGNSDNYAYDSSGNTSYDSAGTNSSSYSAGESSQSYSYSTQSDEIENNQYEEEFYDDSGGEEEW